MRVAWLQKETESGKAGDFIFTKKGITVNFCCTFPAFAYINIMNMPAV
jgi:hypothetical protein